MSLPGCLALNDVDMTYIDKSGHGANWIISFFVNISSFPIYATETFQKQPLYSPLLGESAVDLIQNDTVSLSYQRMSLSHHFIDGLVS